MGRIAPTGTACFSWAHFVLKEPMLELRHYHLHKNNDIKNSRFQFYNIKLKPKLTNKKLNLNYWFIMNGSSFYSPRYYTIRHLIKK
jgi:hypothetical protein